MCDSEEKEKQTADSTGELCGQSRGQHGRAAWSGPGSHVLGRRGLTLAPWDRTLRLPSALTHMALRVFSGPHCAAKRHRGAWRKGSSAEPEGYRGGRGGRENSEPGVGHYSFPGDSLESGVTAGREGRWSGMQGLDCGELEDGRGHRSFSTGGAGWELRFGAVCGTHWQEASAFMS